METRKINNAPTLGGINTAAGATESEKAAKAKASLPAASIDTKSSQGAGSKSVNVALSNQSKDIAEAHKKALDIARNTPDVRENRVAELKKQINDGTYQIDSGKIADGMMREAILDHLSERKE